MIEFSQRDGRYVLEYAGKRIPFQIEYRKRKTLSISVHPDQRLEVVAPAGSAFDKVLSRVDRRKSWILRQWKYFGQFLPQHPDRRFISGETHLYLGRQYRLKVRENSVEGVKLVGRYLTVSTLEKTNSSRVRALVDSWYKEHAERIFRKRMEGCLQNSPAFRFKIPPRFTVRRMSRRWGSCTKAGNILLNLDLVKVPTHCIDYVIVHELCHLKIHDHSPAFYRLLGQCLPDWEQRKARLEQFGVSWV